MSSMLFLLRKSSWSFGFCCLCKYVRGSVVTQGRFVADFLFVFCRQKNYNIYINKILGEILTNLILTLQTKICRESAWKVSYSVDLNPQHVSIWYGNLADLLQMSFLHIWLRIVTSPFEDNVIVNKMNCGFLLQIAFKSAAKSRVAVLKLFFSEFSAICTVGDPHKNQHHLVWICHCWFSSGNTDTFLLANLDGKFAVFVSCLDVPIECTTAESFIYAVKAVNCILSLQHTGCAEDAPGFSLVNGFNPKVR